MEGKSYFEEGNTNPESKAEIVKIVERISELESGLRYLLGISFLKKAQKEELKKLYGLMDEILEELSSREGDEALLAQALRNTFRKGPQ